jgi:N-methylhydantoinase A
VEAVTWTLSLAEPHELPERLSPPAQVDSTSPAHSCRLVEPASGEPVCAALFERQSLPVGACLTGPSVIVEDGTSTIVPTGYTARIGAAHEIVIEEAGT